MSAAQSIGVALVGPGVIAEYHLNGLAADGRVALKAIVGRRLGPAAALAKRFGAQSASDDLDAMLARSDIDALIITTPDDTHEAIAIAALEAGKSIMLQKPMASTSAACQRIITAAVAAHVDLQVSFMHRYFDEVQLARQLIAAGAIGEVTSARIRNATPGPNWGDWFFDAGRVGSGVVAQLGIHGIDLVAYLLGPIQTVSARLATLVPIRRMADGRQVQVHNADTALASYTLASGAMVSHEMSMIEAAGCDRFRLELYGTEGTMWLRTERGALAWCRGDGEWTVPALPCAPLGRRHHEAWLDGLADNTLAESTAGDALAGMQVLETIEASAQAGASSIEVVKV